MVFWAIVVFVFFSVTNFGSKGSSKSNALAKAKSYQKSMSMSTSAIYEQLVSEYGEKFTEEEAQYAIDHLD